MSNASAPSTATPAQQSTATTLESSPTAGGVRASGLLPIALVLFGGLAAWLSLIVINNITDFGTNQALLKSTLTMQGIIDDPVKGNGLEWRALPGFLATPALIAVIAYQLGTIALMWRAVVTGVRALRRPSRRLAPFVRHVNHALIAFLGLFLGFLVGGLWFGYWIALGAVQQVHFTLLIVGIATTVLINLLPIAARQPSAPEVSR